MNKLKREMDRIEIPKNLHKRARLGVRQAKAEKSVLYRVPKPVYFAGVTLLFISLLIGSTFVSPTMSGVLAKVPYLKTFFESKPVQTIIEEELKAQGYNIHGVDESPYPDKIMYVAVNGTEEYLKSVEGEIEEKTTEILAANNYDAFSVQVIKPRIRNRDHELSPETKRYVDESHKIMEKMKSIMDEHGYHYLTFGVRHNKKEHFVTISLPDTSKDIDKLKKWIGDGVNSLGFGEFPVKINLVDMEQREIENNVAGKIIPVLHEGLRARKEFHTKGMAYSFHPAPLQIIVKTTIHSEDNDADELAKKIESTVQAFLTSEEIKKLLKGEPYKIVVRSSDQKQIN